MRHRRALNVDETIDVTRGGTLGTPGTGVCELMVPPILRAVV